jgi:hypothetical protein
MKNKPQSNQSEHQKPSVSKPYKPDFKAAAPKPVPAQEETVNAPQLGVHDVEITLTMDVVTRTQTVFHKMENQLLRDVLDPKSRGFLNKAIEDTFSRMAGFVNRALNEEVQNIEAKANHKPGEPSKLLPGKPRRAPIVDVDDLTAP